MTISGQNAHQGLPVTTLVRFKPVFKATNASRCQRKARRAHRLGMRMPRCEAFSAAMGPD